jgi:hypothetical protein
MRAGEPGWLKTDGSVPVRQSSLIAETRKREIPSEISAATAFDGGTHWPNALPAPSRNHAVTDEFAYESRETER